MISIKVTKIILYDEATQGRSITYSTQRVGSGDDEGLTSALNTTSMIPGSLVASEDEAAIDGTVYTRTILTGLEQEVQDIANMCWTEAIYTAHEAKLRA